MTIPIDLQHPEQVAMDREHKTQQVVLRELAKSLNLTQKALARRMSSPWRTFEKWLLPDSSADSHDMPPTAWALVREIQAHEKLKAQVSSRNSRR